jgi:hypothetical protein
MVAKLESEVYVYSEKFLRRNATGVMKKTRDRSADNVLLVMRLRLVKLFKPIG